MNKDGTLAANVIKHDTVVDKYFFTIKDTLIHEIKSSEKMQAIHLIFNDCKILRAYWRSFLQCSKMHSIYAYRQTNRSGVGLYDLLS